MNVHSLAQSLEYLIERIWAELGLVKVYTKKRGAHPDLDDPVCMRTGATIEVGSDHPFPASEVWLLTSLIPCRTCVIIFIDRSLPISGMHLYGMRISF